MATNERVNELGQLVPARLNYDLILEDMIGGVGELLVDVEGASWLSIDLRAGSLTWLVEGTRNGADYTFQLPIYPAGQLGAPVAQVSGAVAAPFTWFVRVAGMSKVRLRVTAFVSGPVSAVIASCMSNFPPTGVQPPEPLPLLVRPAMVAANTAVTVTIPAPGVGLYQIIHQIKVWGHNSSAAAVAPTATQAITSTNLNAIAWNNINDYPAWTKKTLIDMDIENGLRAQVANTACTIVIPALGAGVVTEALVLYKNGA